MSIEDLERWKDYVWVAGPIAAVPGWLVAAVCTEDDMSRGLFGLVASVCIALTMCNLVGVICRRTAATSKTETHVEPDSSSSSKP